MSSEKRDLHIWLPEDLVDQVDAYANARGRISRTEAIGVLLTDALTQAEGEPTDNGARPAMARP